MVSLFKLIWFHRPWLQSIRKGKMCFLNLCAVRREACWVFGPPWWLKQVSTEAQTLFYYPENAELYLNLVCLAQWVLSSWEYLLRRLQVQFPLCPYNIYNYIIRIYLYKKNEQCHHHSNLSVPVPPSVAWNPVSRNCQPIPASLLFPHGLSVRVPSGLINTDDNFVLNES